MPCKPKDMVRALKKLGFLEHHQTGSHLMLKHPDGRRLVVPMHNTDLKKGLFHRLLKDAGLTEAALNELL